MRFVMPYAKGKTAFNNFRVLLILNSMCIQELYIYTYSLVFIGLEVSLFISPYLVYQTSVTCVINEVS